VASFDAATSFFFPDVPASLPQDVRAPAQAPPPDQIVADYTADGRLTVNQQPVALEEAESRFREIFVSRREKALCLIGAPTATLPRDHASD